MIEHPSNYGPASTIGKHVIVETILALLAARASGASICPSEVARRLSPDAWRDLMPTVRAVAAELAAAGSLRITQGAAEVAPEAVLTGAVRGPLRLRLRGGGGDAERERHR